MRIFAILLSVLLLIPACATSHPQPKEPAASISPATPTPTAAAPPMPVEAEADSEAGAIAFVRHYIDVFNYASNTGDVNELQRLSDPTCEGCTEYINLYKKTYADGGYFKDSGWRVTKSTYEKDAENPGVWITVDAPMNWYRSSTNTNVERGSSGKYTLYFHISAKRAVDVFERAAK